MVQYYCNICNFSTTIKTHYNRHIDTKKHNYNLTNISDKTIKNNMIEKEMIENHENKYLEELVNIIHFNNNIDNEDHNLLDNFISKKYKKIDNKVNDTTEKKFRCDNCDKLFTYKNSYYRHKKNYCKNKLSKKIDNDISKQDDLIVVLLENKNKIIEEKNKCINRLLDLYNIKKLNVTQNKNSNNVININNNITNNYNIKNYNYVLNFINYQNADTMESLNDKFKLSKQEFIKASTKGNYRDALLEKANNIIIDPYFIIQQKRPLHTLDIKRKKALYKDNHHTHWTLKPDTNIDHCINSFHLSALKHQDETIKENENLIIQNKNDPLYKQIYFVPLSVKQRDNIYREVKNYIYYQTKISPELL